MRAEAPDSDWPLLETVMTTRDRGDSVNCAAIGVRWGPAEVVFWPFAGTRTLRNLRRHGEAVAHLTSDVLLFVQAALGRPQPPVRDASVIDGAVIEPCAAWRELVISEIAADPGGLARSRVRARVVAEGAGSEPPAGLCRARHAAVEASIAASRLRWLGAERVTAELASLQDLIDRTGGPREREAMDYVRAHVARSV